MCLASECECSCHKVSPSAADILTGVAELGSSCSPGFIRSLRNAVRDHPSANWSDSLSRGQIRSKQWLVEELKGVLGTISAAQGTSAQSAHLGRVYLCAGWYAILADMMLHEFGDKIKRIRSFDIDPQAVAVAETLMKHRAENWQVKSVVMDIQKLLFTVDKLSLKRQNGEVVHYEERPDTVINTSCEHINDFDKWWLKIPGSKFVVMQSNNFFEHVDHINCVASLSQFAEQTPMTKVLYSGSLELPLYTRYMRIGVK